MLDGRYRLDTPIAAGGMGEVWRGTDLALSRAVAIKLLHPEHASQPDGLARFRAEAQHAGSLSHPNIAQVYDYCEPAPPDPAYLVLELVDGPSLARHLDGGPLSPARTLDVIEQAASGLAAAHRAGLLHRDIKPGNLLLSHDGLIKITDFGIARAAGSLVHTRTGALTGTPAYLAPERFAGAPATPASDLYALGVVAHQCLTGQLPFAGDPLVVALAHVERDMPPLPDSVPAELAALVADLTRKDPRARPASAVAVLARAGLIRAAVFGSAANSAFGGTASAGTSFAGTSAAAGTESGHTAAMDSPAGYSPAGYSPAGYSPAGYSPAGYSPAGQNAAGPNAGGPDAVGDTAAWDAPAWDAPGWDAAASDAARDAAAGNPVSTANPTGTHAAGTSHTGTDPAGTSHTGTHAAGTSHPGTGPPGTSATATNSTAISLGGASRTGTSAGDTSATKTSVAGTSAAAAAGGGPGPDAPGRHAPRRRNRGRSFLVLAGLATAGLAGVVIWLLAERPRRRAGRAQLTQPGPGRPAGQPTALAAPAPGRRGPARPGPAAGAIGARVMPGPATDGTHRPRADPADTNRQLVHAQHRTHADRARRLPDPQRTGRDAQRDRQRQRRRACCAARAA